MTTEMIQTDCKICRTHLPDLLLEEGYAASHPDLAAHLAACTECRTELAELQATFAMLDDFAAPEPTPYFDSKLHARLREAQAAEPEGFWERIRSFIQFSTGRAFQPAMVGAFALLLIIGGGTTAVQLRHGAAAPVPIITASATVDDLNLLDTNAQAEQQMGQLLDESGSEDDDTPPTT